MRGRPPTKLIKRSQFRDDHFDPDCNFVYTELDKVTQKVRSLAVRHFTPHHLFACQTKITVMKTPGTKDLMSALTSDTSTSEDRRKLVQLKDLLEKVLTIDPEKRIVPKAVLDHPFIVDKKAPTA